MIVKPNQKLPEKPKRGCLFYVMVGFSTIMALIVLFVYLTIKEFFPTPLVIKSPNKEHVVTITRENGSLHHSEYIITAEGGLSVTISDATKGGPIRDSIELIDWYEDDKLKIEFKSNGSEDAVLNVEYIAPNHFIKY